MQNQGPAWTHGEILVGRTDELRKITQALLGKPDLVRPVVVTGPAGFGKTALVGAFAREHAAAYPGGYVRLSAAQVSPDDRAFIAVLTERLGLRVSMADQAFGPVLGGAPGRGGIEDDAGAVRERLLSPATFLQIDDVDTREAMVAVTRLVRQLRGCGIAMTGRVEALGAGQDWEGIRLGSLGADAAEDLLSRVYAPPADEAEKEERKALIAALGGSPLALRLVAGLLRAGEDAPALRSMVEGRRDGEEQPPSSGSRLRKTLDVMVERALVQLEGMLGEGAATQIEALRYFAQAPPSGTGNKLGAAIVGLSENNFEQLMQSAEQLGIVRSVPGVEEGATRWSMHPALAEVVGQLGKRDVALARITAWFVERLPREGAGQVEVEEEIEALAWWLGVVPENEWARVAKAGQNFADTHGPYEAWMTFCERALPKTQDNTQRYPLLWIVGNIALHRADLASARSVADELIDVAELQGNQRNLAFAWKVLADVHAAYGQTRESVRILQEAVLPRLDKERDASAVMAIYATLTDILERDGYLDSALGIREKIAEYFASIADKRAHAAIVGGIARIKFEQDHFDEALSLTESSISTLENAGDKLGVAAVWSIRGDIRLAQGHTAEALTIYRDRVLPTLRVRGNRSAIAYTSSRIAAALEKLGQYQEALRIRTQEVIPHVERLGDERVIAGEKFAVGLNLEEQRRHNEALRIYTEEVEPVFARFDERENLSKLWYVIANLLNRIDDPASARALVANKLVPFFEEAGNQHGHAVAFSIIAEAQASLGDFVASIRTYATDVWPFIEKTGTQEEKARTLASWGVALAAHGDYDHSIEMLRKALILFQQLGSTEGAAVQARLGRNLLRRNRPGDIDAADHEITQALADAERTTHRSAPAFRRLLRNPTIERIEITNFKAIKHLLVDFARPENPTALSGQWTCIFGVNGAGKSGILQAIALVLLGDELARDVRSGRLERMRRRDGDRIHDAEIHATVRVAGERHKLSLHISEKGIDDDRIRAYPGFDKMRAFWSEREKDHVLLSYGPGRNLSERAPHGSHDDAEDVRRQLTLFDPLMQVASAEVLLREHEHTKRIFPLLRKLLARILQDTPITLDPDRSSIRFRVGSARVDPVDLPDGFRATIAWLADLCATWAKKAPDEAEGGDPSVIRGIVLLDEIDLHLHPGLQRVLVPRLRLALPEVQWIVTSHSPLILGSFDKSEIVPVEMDPEKGVRLGDKLDRQILGFTANEVYEYLMHVKPRSEAIEHFGDSPEDRARQNLILAQSPNTSEAEAIANRDYRRKLAEQRREKARES